MSSTRWKDASYNLGKRYVYKDCRIFTMFDYNFSCSLFVQTPPSIQSGDVARFPVHPCLPVLLRPLVVANMLIYPCCSLALWTAHHPDFLVHHWLLLFCLLCWSSPFAQPLVQSVPGHWVPSLLFIICSLSEVTSSYPIRG